MAWALDAGDSGDSRYLQSNLSYAFSSIAIPVLEFAFTTKSDSSISFDAVKISDIIQINYRSWVSDSQKYRINFARCGFVDFGFILAANTRYKIKCECTSSTTWNLYINDVLIGSNSGSGIATAIRSVAFNDGLIEYAHYSENGVTVFNWDATASDHSNTGEQPVLVDTIGGNHATGYNFPTDGSAWESTGGSLIPVSNSLGLLSSSLAPVYNNLSSTSSVLGGVSSNFDISSSVLSAVNGATTVSSSSLSNISSSRVVSSSVLGTANTSTQLLSSTLGSTQHTVPLLSSTLGTVTSPVEVVSSVLASVVSAIDNSVVISSSALSSITNSTDSRSSVLASASGSNKLDSSVLGSVTTSYELQSSVFNSITNSANIINNVLGSVSNSVGSKSSILGSVVKSIPITSSSLSGVQNVVVLTTSSGINTLDVESINSFTIYSEPVTAFTMVSINENRYTID